MGKSTGGVSIIGGADGPTSIFIAGKGGKVKLITRIQNYFCKIKRNRIKRKNLKASLIMRHRPGLLGELMDLELPEREDMKSLKVFWEQTRERERRAMEIADDIFPIDFHIYEIRWARGWYIHGKN